MAIKFFDDQSSPQEEVRPTPTRIHKQVNKALGLDLHVCMPATIITYDYKKQMASVQPSFSNQYNDGTVSPLPIIYNVPVQWPSSGTGYTHFPLNKGDQITLHFSDKALDQWLSSGAVSQPNDSRTHHIADAIAVPGCRSFNKPLNVSNGTDAIVGLGNLEFRLKPNGHVQIIQGLNTSGSLELLSTINDFMTAAITGDWGGMIQAQSLFQRFLES